MNGDGALNMNRKIFTYMREFLNNEIPDRKCFLCLRLWRSVARIYSYTDAPIKSTKAYLKNHMKRYYSVNNKNIKNNFYIEGCFQIKT